MQQLLTVCDECGTPAAETITFRHQGQQTSKQKDLCGEHLSELDHGARAARRGRPTAKKAVARKRSRAKR